MKFVKITLHRCYASSHFSTRTPTRDGRLGTRTVGQSVGRWSQNFPSYSGVQIHSLGQRTFQAVCSANFVICKHILFGPLDGLWIYCILCTLFFVSVWQPAAYGILFLNNHKTETDREPRFLLKNLPQIRKWKPSQH